MLLPPAEHATRIGTIEDAAQVIGAGGVVAYPTESCFGIGCDPHNIDAVKRILSMKKRQRDKGVILIADKFERFAPFIEELPADVLSKIQASWPGPHTWLCPSKPACSPWLRGSHCNLAIRVTSHRSALRLCQRSNSALVSTSANLSTSPALVTADEVAEVFEGLVDFIVDELVGRDKQPSTIRNALTGEVIR